MFCCSLLKYSLPLFLLFLHHMFFSYFLLCFVFLIHLPRPFWQPALQNIALVTAFHLFPVLWYSHIHGRRYVQYVQLHTRPSSPCVDESAQVSTLLENLTEYAIVLLYVTTFSTIYLYLTELYVTYCSTLQWRHQSHTAKSAKSFLQCIL